MREVAPGNQGGGEAQPRCPDSQWVDQPDKNQHGRTSVERTPTQIHTKLENTPAQSYTILEIISIHNPVDHKRLLSLKGLCHAPSCGCDSPVQACMTMSPLKCIYIKLSACYFFYYCRCCLFQGPNCSWNRETTGRPTGG